MKKYKGNSSMLIAGIVFISFTLAISCDSYLDQTPESLLSEEDIFSTYEGCQGFLDKSYLLIMDVLNTEAGAFPGFGDDFISVSGHIPTAASGDYWRIIGPSNTWTIFFVDRSQWSRLNPGPTKGVWPDAWEGIRMANLTLEKLDLMVDATQEERELIEGQCYFFRAYQHFNLIRYWGGMPYIDKVLGGNDDINRPRLTYWETTEQIVADLDLAAELLPENWETTGVGKKYPGRNWGRITKGSALGLKAKALLMAGSPTMVNNSSGRGYVFDDDYMKRAAEAAYEVIKLADKGVYSLLSWEDYYTQFGRNDGFLPFSKETLVACINDAKGYNFADGGPGGSTNGFAVDYNGVGSGVMAQKHGRNLSPSRFGGNVVTAGVTQNQVDMFETINGLPIEEDPSYNPMDPWENRDPRFRGGILVDQDQWTFANPDVNKLNMYIGGGDAGEEFASPYLCKKFWPKGVNSYDRQWDEYRISNPVLRLAEIYLIYAEAVNEIQGPQGTIEGATLTAAEAVNIVRNRANMPDVNEKFLTNSDLFRQRIWNERAVELFAEDGTRWADLKRWHVAHLEKYRNVYTLLFDAEQTYYEKKLYQTKVFDEKHYWLPIYREQTQLYPEFYQNPGW